MTKAAEKMVLSGHTIVPASHPTKIAPEVQHLLDWSKRFPQPEQKSTEWRNQRAYYCTASQHASALGRCKYKSRNDCLRQYAGVIKNTFTGNAATKHGERYEDEAVERYKQLRCVDVEHFGMLPFYEQSDWLGGSPDGVSVDGYLIEVKCPYRRKPNGQVPPHYMPQIQSMMHGLNLSKCHFIEYVPGSQWTDEVFDVIEVPRDPEYWKVVLPLLRTFWEEVTVLRDTVTDDISFEEKPPVKKRKRADKPPEPCNIVYQKPTARNSKNTVYYTAAELPMRSVLAQLCVQGLGGDVNT